MATMAPLTTNYHAASFLGRLGLRQFSRVPTACCPRVLSHSRVRLYTTSPSENPPPRPGASQFPSRSGKLPFNGEGRKYIFPEKLIIYHAGTGRILFLAVLKLTTIAVAVLFMGVLAPAFYSEGKPSYQTAGLCFAGLIPVTFVAYTTSPLVSILHMHLPTVARTSRAHLERFVRSLPPQTRLEATTLSLIAKPRVSYFEARDLKVPSAKGAGRRFGLVDFVRDTKAENASRKWYMFRAVGRFSMQGGNKGVKEGWIWDEIRGRIQRRALCGA